MKRKGIAIFIGLALLICFFSGCTGKNSGESSSIPTTEHLVVGSAYEGGGEYPYFNESILFSDVSVPLTSDVPSKENSSQKDNNSSEKNSYKDKNSSSKNTTTSSKNDLSSILISSEVTSVSISSEKSSSISSSSQSVGSGLTVNYNNMKAVWISYIDFADILTGKSEAQFRANFKKACQNAVEFGINTLVCHVRAFGDAFYPSEYFSWSKNVGGIGKNPGFDPLKIMIELAHQHNLSFHAWINPFRTYLDTEVSSVPSNSVFKKWHNDSSKNGKYIVNVGNRWYYNPGYPDVRNLIIDGVKEIINNYSVDGIHFDDYFYPTTDKSFDGDAFKAYGAGKSLENWRRENVSSFVKSVYNAVKAKNKNIVFGISPQANVQNDMNMQYADVKLWGSQNGYVDYLCPQVYFNYVSESLDFSSTLSTWNKLVTASNVRLVIGLSVDRIGWYDRWACNNRDTHTASTPNCGAFGWRTDNPAQSNILARQYDDSMSLKKCSGVFLYSYQYVFNPASRFVPSDKYADNALSQAKYEIQKLKDAMKKK